jgi:pectate lyase
MNSISLISILAVMPAAMACLGHDGGLPTPTGEKTLSEPQYIGAGEVFDAGWVKYDRGVACGGQSEGGKFSHVLRKPRMPHNIKTYTHGLPV